MNTKGITLMEVILAVAIFVLATFMIAIFIIQNFQAQNFSMEQSLAIGEARRGVETMVKELRETLPGDTGAYPIESANDQQLIFYADYDRDDAIEKVRYWLDDTEFKKGVIEARLEKHVEIETDDSEDGRSYEVDFSKSERLLGFKPRYSLEDGIVELLENFTKGKYKDALGFWKYHNKI